MSVACCYLLTSVNPTGRSVNRRAKRILKWLLGISLFLVLSYFLLLQWLASDLGRGQIERRLSEQLGTEVRLVGRFSFGLIPNVHAQGDMISLNSAAGEGHQILARNYTLSMALRPLLQQQVHIEYVEVGDIDLDWQLVQELAGGGSEEPAALPDLRQLNIDNLHIHGLVDDQTISMQDLEFAGLGPGEGDLLFTGELEGNDGDVWLRWNNRWLLRDQGRAFTLQSIEVETPAMGIPAVTGDFALRQQGLEITQLGWSQPEWGVFSANGRIDSATVDLAFTYQIDNLLPLLDVRTGSVDIDINAGIKGMPEALAITLQSTLSGQSVNGQGCLLSTGDTPGLYLRLIAEQLDIRALLGIEWSSEPQQGQIRADADPELLIPFVDGIGISLDAGILIADDWEAEDVTIHYGSMEDCPAPGT